MDPSSEAARRIGEVLRGKWKLEKVIGVGGMAAVYAATHRNGMKGAVKLLHPEFAKDTESRERFLREGYVANRVERGAVKVLDDDATEDGSVYLVMELLTGETTDEIAQRRPNEQLTVPEVVWVGQALLDVLAQAHDVGIVHRDIKPENLFVCSNGELRVLDFGIARLRDGKPGGLKKTNTANTMGTPAFMPSEQALADWERVGPRSDLYSAGATLFTLLTGELTHPARTAQEIIIAVATKPARPLRSLMPSAPEALAAVIDKACAFRPEDRFQDARAMRAALDAAARGMRPVPPSKNAPAPGLSASPAVDPRGGAGPGLSGSVGQPFVAPAPQAYPYGAPQPPAMAAQVHAASAPHVAPAPSAMPQRPYPGHAATPLAEMQGHPRHGAYGAPSAPNAAPNAYAAWAEGSGVHAAHARVPHAGEVTGPIRPMAAGEITGPRPALGEAPSSHAGYAPPPSTANMKTTMRVDPRAAQEAYMPAQWNTASGGISPAARVVTPTRGSSARVVLVVVGALLAIVLVTLVAVIATR